MSLPKISVVVCTHNRSVDTAGCLDALYPQIAGGRAELILVDSASSPSERSALAKCVERYPELRLIRLDVSGLSLARNAGIKASEGDWVAFLDDDAVPCADWFGQLQDVVARAPGDCAALGGRILPLFPGGEAVALRMRHKMYVSVNDSFGDHDCSEKFELIAANCCFRRAALLQVGGFPLGVGRVGTQLLSGEDVMLMRALRAARWRIRYNSAFCVGHKITRERLTSEWIRKRAFWEGITTARMAGLMADPTYWRIVGKAIIAAPLTWLMTFTARPEAEWDLRFAFNRGVLVEACWNAPKAWMLRHATHVVGGRSHAGCNIQKSDQHP